MMNQTMSKVCCMVHKCKKMVSHLGLVRIALFVQTLTSLLLERRKNSTGTASVSSASSRPQREVSQSEPTRWFLCPRFGSCYGCFCVDGLGTEVRHCNGRGSLGRNAIHLLPTAASESRSECSSGAVTIMTIKQPQIAEIYYATCGAIDRNTRYCQDNPRIEKKVETKDWSVCANISSFAMLIVNTWLVYNAFFKNGTTQQRKCLQKEFYFILAEELVGLATTIGEEERDDRCCPQMGHPTKRHASGPWKVDVHALKSSPTWLQWRDWRMPMERRHHLVTNAGTKSVKRRQLGNVLVTAMIMIKRCSFAQPKMENGDSSTMLLATMHT